MPTRSKEDILDEIGDVEAQIESWQEDFETAQAEMDYAGRELMDLEDLLGELQDELSQLEAEDEAE